MSKRKHGKDLFSFGFKKRPKKYDMYQMYVNVFLRNKFI